MASSGIGGQAVMEGVMMKNKDRYAVAVRKPDAKIVVESREYHSICKYEVLRKLPVIRGVINFIDSMVLGMKTLTFSASFFEEEEEGGEKSVSPEASRKKDSFPETEPDSKKDSFPETEPDGKKDGFPETEPDGKKDGFRGAEPDGKRDGSGKKEQAAMGLTVCVSILLAVGIFMVIPYYISLLFQKIVPQQTLVILLEGVIRLAIFILYILLISRMEEIRRVFMYHGAEHKCINCIEHGLELNVENVKKSSKEHKRCGTSFLFFVVIVSIIATLFIRVDSRLLRLLLRILIVPLVAGVSYEIIRLAGNSENPVVNLLSKPGLWMQRLTTKEPDEDMIEVGIASVEAVFDWKEYLAGRKEDTV